MPPLARQTAEGREEPAPPRGGERDTMTDTLKKFAIAVAAVVVGLWAFNKIGKYIPV